MNANYENYATFQKVVVKKLFKKIVAYFSKLMHYNVFPGVSKTECPI